jgi:hypothetical protein
MGITSEGIKSDKMQEICQNICREVNDFLKDNMPDLNSFSHLRAVSFIAAYLVAEALSRVDVENNSVDIHKKMVELVINAHSKTATCIAIDKWTEANK